mgnify:CR=1 FL=1
MPAENHSFCKQYQMHGLRWLHEPACYVRYIVREEGETCRFGHNVVTAPGVSAVIHTDIKLSSQDLPSLSHARRPLEYAGQRLPLKC